jgi:hypothetical protein
MRVAEPTRPQSKPGPASRCPDESRVDGFSATPVEGLDISEFPAVPMQPHEVLELLKARLALDDGSDAPALTGRISHEAVAASSTSWPPVSGVRDRTPSYPDVTPSPLVIGIGPSENPRSSYPDASAIPANVLEEWREAAARDTPAEPIASVRARHASLPSEIPTQSRLDANRVEENARSSASPTRGGIVERLYFPPMKPPGSWRDARANEPLVQVVPDCNAKTRTARGLKRPSGRPTRSSILDYWWAPVLAGVGLAIATIVWISLAPSAPRSQASRTLLGETRGAANESYPAAAVLAIPVTSSPSALPDSGTNSPPLDARSVVPVLSAAPQIPRRASTSQQSQSTTPRPQVKSRSRDVNPAKPKSPGVNDLLF